MVVTVPETKPPAPSNGLWRLAPLAVSLLAAGLAAIDVRRSFTLAEIEEVLQSRRPWRDLVPIWHPDAGSSVYLALLKGWSHVGSTEWVTRVPSLVAVALAAAVVCALGTRLVERRVGLAAGTLFAISSYTTGLGRAAGPLALAVLAATVATWLFIVAIESGGLTPWSAYACIAVVSVYVHASCALVLVAHGAALVVRGRRASRRNPRDDLARSPSSPHPRSYWCSPGTAS